MCSVSCMNGGQCVAPETCSCLHGYTGVNCETGNKIIPGRILKWKCFIVIKIYQYVCVWNDCAFVF